MKSNYIINKLLRDFAFLIKTYIDGSDTAIHLPVGSTNCFPKSQNSKSSIS